MMFILFLRSEAKLEAWHWYYTASVKFPRPDKIDRFVHNDGDRKPYFLSLSLQLLHWFLMDVMSCVTNDTFTLL
jgi:hypothetical protein